MVQIRWPLDTLSPGINVRPLTLPEALAVMVEPVPTFTVV